MTFIEATLLFDRFTMESIYGYNMRMVMCNETTEEEAKALWAFIDKCEARRKATDQPSKDVSEQ